MVCTNDYRFNDAHRTRTVWVLWRPFLTPPDQFPLNTFPLTEWPLVDAVTQNPVGAKDAALATLLCRYYPVLKSSLARQYRVTEEQAADWLQSFVLEKVLQRDLFSRANRNHGKFRTFLLRSLNNFVIQQMRHARANKRAPTEQMLSIHDLEEMDLVGIASPQIDSFDVAWAKGVLAETVQRMERYCQTSDQMIIWEVFQCRLLKPLFEEAEPVPYEEFIKKFGLQSPTQAMNLLITGKRIFGRFLHSVIGEYAVGEKEVEAEIQDLKAILFRA
jgi:DNA-directed RNA polymerase specialized sigma24 family protein